MLERHGFPERSSGLAVDDRLPTSGPGNDRNEWYFGIPQGQEVVAVTGSVTISSETGAAMSRLAVVSAPIDMALIIAFPALTLWLPGLMW